MGECGGVEKLQPGGRGAEGSSRSYTLTLMTVNGAGMGGVGGAAAAAAGWRAGYRFFRYLRGFFGGGERCFLGESRSKTDAKSTKPCSSIGAEGVRASLRSCSAAATMLAAVCLDIVVLAYSVRGLAVKTRLQPNNQRRRSNSLATATKAERMQMESGRAGDGAFLCNGQEARGGQGG